MCGICGIFDATGNPRRTASLVHSMAESLAHRGPEDQGIASFSRCTLGHRRLRIIDLSPLGKQPMTNEDESLWISFNGEVYNYLPLREELLRNGHQFRSQSDTEVILHLYEERGDDFVCDLNGMFAIALWDERRSRLLLARDRFGKKPLYYYSDGKRLLFGSELKAILADPMVPRELDHDALSMFLALQYIPAPNTIFKNIYKLPAASTMVAELDSSGTGIKLHQPRRYWNLRYTPDPSITESDCLDEIWGLIKDATRIRMYSDVPLGAFLSGGLDSSTVVAAMSEVSRTPPKTFAVGFDEASHNELPFAETVARHLGTDHHTLECTPNALEVLPLLVQHYDEPLADPSCVPTYYVSKLARQFVTVALSGDGGDEVFAGYTRYSEALQRAELLNFLPSVLVRKGFSLAMDIYPAKARGWGILHRHSLDSISGYCADLSTFHRPHKDQLLAGNGQRNGFDPTSLFREVAARAGASDLLSQMQYLDQQLYLPDDILVKVDRASMAVALETRAPLLDYRLAELLARVPASLRFRNRTTKYLLKRAMETRLPAPIIHRAKMGFGVPLKQWFRGGASDFAADILLSQAAQERGLFRGDEIKRLVDEHIRGERDFSWKIWTLLFFEMWCRTWLDQRVAAEAAIS